MGSAQSKKKREESSGNSGEEEMSQPGHSQLMEEELSKPGHSQLMEEVDNFIKLHLQGKLFTKNELRLRIDQLKSSLFELK